MQGFSNNVVIPGLLNVRDLGGYPTRDGGKTRWKAFLRADAISRLLPEGVVALQEYGVRTLLDLRFAGDSRARPGLPVLDETFHRIQTSLLGENLAAWRSVCPATTRLELYNCTVLESAKPHILSTMRAIVQAPEGTLLFHCVSGKDRTGVIAALLLAVADVEPEAIASDYAASTENLRDAYLVLRKAKATPKQIIESVRCPEEQIYNMLAHLAEHYGGVNNYMRAIGLTEDELSQLRARLRGSETNVAARTARTDNAARLHIPSMTSPV